MSFGLTTWQEAEDAQGPGAGYEEPDNIAGDIAETVKEKGQEWWTKSGMWAPGEAAEILRADVEAMKAGDLGLSEQEREQLASKAQTAAGAQIQAQQAQLARERMAGGGGFGGQYAELQQQLGAQAGEAGARARAAADEASQRLAEARRAEILGRLERQQDRAREDIQAAREAIADVFTGVFDAAMTMQGAGAPTP